MTKQINEADWQEKVLDADKPVLVDFFATWCGPCKMMAPVIESIAEEMAGTADVYTLDIDDSPNVAQRYGVMSIPMFIVFKKGEPVAKALGSLPKEQILSLFK